MVELLEPEAVQQQMDAADDKPWWIDIYEPSRHTFNKTNERGFEYNCIVRHRVKILVMCISRILIKINYLLTYIRSMSHMTVFDNDLAKLNVPYPNNLVNYLSNSIWCGWCSRMTDILTFTFTFRVDYMLRPVLRPLIHFGLMRKTNIFISNTSAQAL